MTDFCKGVCVDLWKEVERLQADNERLREENKSLHDAIDDIKKYYSRPKFSDGRPGGLVE